MTEGTAAFAILLALAVALPGYGLAALLRRRPAALERRARLLETAVNVSHAVGMTLDPVEVFRALYHQVAAVLPVDAFFVAITDADRTLLDYRFLVDENGELEPTQRPLAGTLAGLCIERGGSILLRDADRDRERLGIARAAWGTVQERSIVVAPLRLGGQVIGAISAQSVRPDAYGPAELELIENIAGEAAIAIERAELHDRTERLSRHLVDLHRIGVELVTQRDQTALARRLAAAAGELLHGRTGVYLDTGADTLTRADLETSGQKGVQSIQRRGTPTDEAIRTGQPVVVTLDSPDLPEASRRLMESGGTPSVLIHPLRAAEESIGVLYVGWTDVHRVTDEERELAGLICGIGATALRSVRLYAELDDAYLSTVMTLSATTEAREGYREDHLRRVAADAVALGQRLGLPDEALRVLRLAALFHSLGKIAIPASILTKQGPLTPDESRLVKEHPVLGAHIVGSIRFLQDVAPVVRHLNERWDGTGYPDGLSGEHIPRLARILAVPVAYQAMRSDRPYRGALPSTAALAQLRLSAGRAFDPIVVEEFAQLVEARGVVSQAEQEVGVARELAILAELTPQFHSLLDLQQLLERVLGVLERRMPGTRVAIMLEDPTTGDLVLRASVGTWPPSAQRRQPKGKGVMGWVMEHGQAQIVDDVHADTRWIGPADDGARSALVAPLLAGGRTIGVIGLLHPAVAAFGQRDLALMQAVGAQLAAAIEVAGLHERIKVAASTDGLTGIHNHRYFWERLGEELSRAERRDLPVSVAYFDIDRLKLVNDEHGHLAGDAVLRTLGQLIASNVRQEDVPVRYGGDEFAIIMPETPREEATKAVARLMELIDAVPVDLGNGTRIGMPTRSWGVATYPEDGRTAKEIVERADARAYTEKRAAR